VLTQVILSNRLVELTPTRLHPVRAPATLDQDVQRQFGDVEAQFLGSPSQQRNALFLVGRVDVRRELLHLPVATAPDHNVGCHASIVT